MSDPGEGGANGNGLLDVEKSAANFGFGDGGHNIGKNLGRGEDGAIVINFFPNHGDAYPMSLLLMGSYVADDA